MSSPANRVFALFAVATGAVVLRAILVCHVIASASYQGGLAALARAERSLRTDQMFGEFDAVVLVCCLAAFIFWVHSAWARGGNWPLRILRCAGVLVASVGILLLLREGLHAEWLM